MGVLRFLRAVTPSALSAVGFLALLLAGCDLPTAVRVIDEAEPGNLTGPYPTVVVRDFSELVLNERETGPDRLKLAPSIVFLDGVELGVGDARLYRLDSEEIVCIEVMKGSVAVRAFGDRAWSGVIWIITERGNTGRCQ